MPRRSAEKNFTCALYLKSFWNESFASYCPGLYFRHRDPANHAEMARAFVSSPSANPVYDQYAVSDAGDVAALDQSLPVLPA